MGQIVTVTSRSMLTIPVMVMERYGLRQGSKIEFIETEGGILLRPVKTPDELRDARRTQKAYRAKLRELEKYESTDEAPAQETASPSERGAMNFLSAHGP